VSVSASYPWCFSVFLSFFYASALSLNVARIKRNESWELRFMLHYVAAVSGVAVVAGVAAAADAAAAVSDWLTNMRDSEIEKQTLN